MKINISENIRNMRKQRDMMQEQLAEALGVSIGAVSKWERGAAVPDLSYIVEMADLFGVSVDTLVGYQVQSGAAKALEERIHDFQRKKDYESAVAEAEKALVRYPNDFAIVYRCGEMYQLNGIENGNIKAVERAIELLNHAILLLPQNTDPEISELSIQTEIAHCYLVLDRKDKALDLLKKYNAGGIHNALIGLTYATTKDYEPKEAEQYLMRAFSDVFASLVRIMTGYINYYARMKDYEATLDATLWLIRYMESIKISEDAVSYVDKVCVPFYSECANLSDILGRKEDAKRYLKKAYQVAEAFDEAPVYNVYQMKFRIGDTENAVAYDDIGQTAIDAIERHMERESFSDYLRAIWSEIKEES